MIVILGAFDGFHLGHRRLLDCGRELAAVSSSAEGSPLEWGVATFTPHPGNILQDKKIPVLFTEEERNVLGRFLHIPRTIKIPFTRELASASPSDFLSFLEKMIPVTGIVVGKDFRFGKDRQGDTTFLRKTARRRGWIFKEIEPFTIDGKKVGSSSIRSYIAHGEVYIAKRFLGYPFFFSGMVVPGDGRGAVLGFPTANVHYPDEKIMPKRGVYGVSAFVDRQWFPGALNVGFNPTFLSNRRLHAETHILGYDGSLYNKTIGIFLEEFLRDEEKFDTPADLVEQMKEDVIHAEEIFKRNMETNETMYKELAEVLSLT